MNDFKAIPKVIGTKQTLKQVAHGKARKVVLAMDADEPIKKEVLEACQKADIPVYSVKSKHDLGKSCGIERPAAVVTLLKED